VGAVRRPEEVEVSGEEAALVFLIVFFLGMLAGALLALGRI
jgi:hypothetical protein